MKNSPNPSASNIGGENRIIWFPEWEHFKIVKLNHVYQLFEAKQLVFHNKSLETVKAELIERFHFYEIQKPTNN